MNHLSDLICKADSATAVFFFSIAVLVAVSVSISFPPADYKPRLVSPPVAVTPGLVQAPQLLREGRPLDVKAASLHTRN